MSQIKNASNNNNDAQILLMAIFRSIPAARRVAEASGLGGRPEGMLRKAS
ncbi:MAG: hypothetical protein INR70_04590 [Parafilimonas terrae]|nr:hypothetical protein [Parafilimonas terrae]